MPDRVVVVDRPEVCYTHDPERDPKYNLVTRISPDLDDYHELVREVVHRQSPAGDCHFTVASPSHSAKLELTLKEYGFTIRGEAYCFSIDVLAERPPLPDQVYFQRIETRENLRDMESVMRECFEHYTGTREEAMERDLALCIGPDARCRRYIARDVSSNAPLAVGALNIYPAEKVGFLWGGATIPDARGRGVYSALVTARMEVAKSLGLSRIGLYAMKNTSSPIVEKQGFEKHGKVTFWVKKFEGKSDS